MRPAECGRSVRVDDAPHLPFEDVVHLVPRYPLVAADAAIFGHPVSQRLPVDALERVLNAVLGVYDLFRGRSPREQRLGERRFVRLTVDFDVPRLHLLWIEVHRLQTDDAVVFDVDEQCSGCRACCFSLDARPSFFRHSMLPPSKHPLVLCRWSENRTACKISRYASLMIRAEEASRILRMRATVRVLNSSVLNPPAVLHPLRRG